MSNNIFSYLLRSNTGSLDIVRLFHILGIHYAAVKIEHFTRHDQCDRDILREKTWQLNSNSNQVCNLLAFYIFSEKNVYCKLLADEDSRKMSQLVFNQYFKLTILIILKITLKQAWTMSGPRATCGLPSTRERFF